MGLNTTVLILNDALHQIETDPQFGENLARAIMTGQSIDVSAGCHCNAARVLETHHADMTSVVAVGGNIGRRVSVFNGNHFDSPEDTLKALADSLGFRVVRKSKRSRK
jgi:hypothetical protein